MKLFNLSRSFNWRILLVRILVNAVTLVVLAILPGITFVDPSLGKLLLMALVLGLINAFIKPILQFLTLSFLFVTYGFVLILINAVVLLLLARLFQSYQLASIWAALLGGALIGLISSFWRASSVSPRRSCRRNRLSCSDRLQQVRRAPCRPR